MAANVQSMCQYWKNFDLQDLQKELDTTATDLAARQDESDVSRKRLVEQSREFKKNTPEDIRKIVAPLLKSFQGEIDALSKRSKAAEAAFLTIYKKLIDVPDPLPVFEQALTFQKRAQRVSDLEIENKQLRETLDEYNHEFAEVKNQEVTIKQLKEKVKEYEDKMETAAQSRAKEKERELQRQFLEKEQQLQQMQMDVARKLGEAEQKVVSLQSALDGNQSELFDLKAKYDEATSAKSDEMEIVMADLDRANERVAASEREVEQLKTQLMSANQNLHQAEQMQHAPDVEQAIDILKRSSLEVELVAKEKEIAQLVEDVQKLQASISKMKETTSAQIAKLEEELAAKSRAFQLLEERMKSQEDYEEIKRELEIMKSIEFKSRDGESLEHGKTLEILLLEKNKQLQTENTHLKVSHSELTGAQPEEKQCVVVNSAEAPQVHHDYQNGASGASSPSHPSTPSQKSETTENGFKESDIRFGYVAPDNTLSNSPKTYQNGSIDSLADSADSSSLQQLQSIAQKENNNSHILNTADVSQRIREILSTNNIGQRLFAKHVLGLSQGTVSELLSKPKHWDKLTEKGRESYRKMHAWASDERNVVALKAISPRKGTQPVMSPYKHEDSATEERIAQILSDAQQAIQSKQQQEKSHMTSQMVSSIYQNELAKMANSQVPYINGTVRPPEMKEKNERPKSPKKDRSEISRQKQSDDAGMSQEIVRRIYQKELMKLAQAAQEMGNLPECHKYQLELQKLAQNSQHETNLSLNILENGMYRHLIPNLPQQNGHEIGLVHHREVKLENEPLDLSSTDRGGGGASHNNVRKSPANHTDINTAEKTDQVRHAGSAFCLVRPRSETNFAIDCPYPVNSMSPLQHMQSIANSLVNKSTMPFPPQKPLRAVLPPITQEQFDHYSHINTDDLVKKVKEMLSQYSISQRLFGEHVLGLSQGSVSDLLARPKPWHMLTQKGREPFIRMQIFLEDTEAIPKLVASQYRIAPDKLMRSSNVVYINQGGLPQSMTTTPIIQPAPIHPERNSIDTSPLHSPGISQPSTPLSIVKSEPQNSPCYQQSTNNNDVAVPGEIDTLALTSKVKDVLQASNLGQRLFGESILALSQGSVSELLSKPKPWHMLSLKGREPFIKMQKWLSDPYNVEKLRAYRSHMKGHYQQLQQQYSEAVNSVQEQKQLIAQLEEDLRSVNALSSMFRGDAEGEPSSQSSSHTAEFVADAIKDVTAPLGQEGKHASDSILPIVQSQRERFRVRAQELEAQTISQQQQVHLLQNEIDKLRSDNVKLYEKIKFLQSYPSSQRSAEDGSAFSQYSSRYEEKLDPFTMFSKKERQRKYMNLKPYDKITLSMGRFIMSNRVARTFVFFYTIILHCLVFLVLYKMAHLEDCKRDVAAQCQHNFAEHMLKVHGSNDIHHDH